MSDIKIKSIKAEEILDSKNNPTVQVTLETENGLFLASAPSGVSTGSAEAVELRDPDGRGIKKAIENVDKIIAPVLLKENLTSQNKIDQILINLDGTKNKSHLGANAILPVSLAACRAGAATKKIPLFKYIAELAENENIELPKPSFNMIEGGKHAENGLAFQEFMVVPQRNKFFENFQIGQKIYQKLKEILFEKYGQKGVILSKEGAYNAPLNEINEAFDFILSAARAAGAENDIKFAVDAAASNFFNDELYRINGDFFNKSELTDFYKKLFAGYSFVSIEDPFNEDDFVGFLPVPENLIVFGDDLLASNVERIKIAKEKGTYNGLLLKPNQIGTVSETIQAVKLARSYGWKIMVSNRAGETEDSFIADLAAGISAEFIKSGAPFPKERMVKYNRLVKIEEELYG